MFHSQRSAVWIAKQSLFQEFPKWIHLWLGHHTELCAIAVHHRLDVIGRHLPGWWGIIFVKLWDIILLLGDRGGNIWDGLGILVRSCCNPSLHLGC